MFENVWSYTNTTASIEAIMVISEGALQHDTLLFMWENPNFRFLLYREDKGQGQLQKNMGKTDIQSFYPNNIQQFIW